MPTLMTSGDQLNKILSCNAFTEIFIPQRAMWPDGNSLLMDIHFIQTGQKWNREREQMYLRHNTITRPHSKLNAIKSKFVAECRNALKILEKRIPCVGIRQTMTCLESRKLTNQLGEGISDGRITCRCDLFRRINSR